jgi:hypothetical protein
MANTSASSDTIPIPLTLECLKKLNEWPVEALLDQPDAGALVAQFMADVLQMTSFHRRFPLLHRCSKWFRAINSLQDHSIHKFHAVALLFSKKGGLAAVSAIIWRTSRFNGPPNDDRDQNVSQFMHWSFEILAIVLAVKGIKRDFLKMPPPAFHGTTTQQTAQAIKMASEEPVEANEDDLCLAERIIRIAVFLTVQCSRYYNSWHWFLSNLTWETERSETSGIAKKQNQPLNKGDGKIPDHQPPDSKSKSSASISQRLANVDKSTRTVSKMLMAAHSGSFVNELSEKLILHNDPDICHHMIQLATGILSGWIDVLPYTIYRKLWNSVFHALHAHLKSVVVAVSALTFIQMACTRVPKLADELIGSIGSRLHHAKETLRFPISATLLLPADAKHAHFQSMYQNVIESLKFRSDTNRHAKPEGHHTARQTSHGTTTTDAPHEKNPDQEDDDDQTPLRAADLFFLLRYFQHEDVQFAHLQVYKTVLETMTDQTIGDPFITVFEDDKDKKCIVNPLMNELTLELAELIGLSTTTGVQPQPAADAPSPPKFKSQVAVCFVCAKAGSETLTLNRCSRCKIARYCSTDCQKSDWRKHKLVCQAAPKSTSSASA